MAPARNRHFVLCRSNARSAAHHDHGSHVKAPSAPNQSVAPQPIIQPLNEATSATKSPGVVRSGARGRGGIRPSRIRKVRDGKSGCLLGKSQRKFPDEDDRGVYENRERPGLKFAREIAADPGVWTQDRPMAFRPAARDIGKHRQDRYLVIVVPKNTRIVREEKRAEAHDDWSSA